MYGAPFCVTSKCESKLISVLYSLLRTMGRGILFLDTFQFPFPVAATSIAQINLLS